MTSQRRLDNERAVMAELDRARLKRYFSPRIVEDLLAQPEAFDETRAQRAVVMFADIVGFTTLSERQTPEETITMLREFDTAMEGEIFDNRGVVDKYLGDGVMAAFGLPETGEVDVTSAVRCAMGMLERTRQLAKMRKKAGKPTYRISIGLHVGDVVAGNVGSERNLSFTVIGDTVNTASRLESLSRQYDAAIVVSQDVIDAVRSEAGEEADALLANFEKIGAVTVKGRAEMVDVWVLRDTGSSSTI
jgi:adenylate cyclase